jgi:ADP-ribose pyrophosphatase YjhB (NUDIX family)
VKFCPECASPVVWRVVAGRERAACPTCSFVHYEDPKLVAVALIPIERKLVLGRRSINPRRGYWSFPSGYVDRGEPVHNAAIREVNEETCLVVEIEELLGLYSEPNNPVVLAVYITRAVGGTLEAGDEMSEVGLFATDAMPELAFPNDHRILADWMAFRRKKRPHPPAGASVLTAGPSHPGRDASSDLPAEDQAIPSRLVGEA